jgi:DNA-binding GntR family transcriptional regulator
MTKNFHLSADINKASSAYNEIKRRILDRVYEPGQKLSEVRLADDFGLGRSPIRTALARLRGEQWIEITPQSGTYVRGLTAKEISEVMELRLILEPQVACMAAGRFEAGKLEGLRAKLNHLVLPVSQDELEKYFDFDLDVHLAIYEAAGNALISGILMGLLDKVHWIRQGRVGSLERRKIVLSDLGSILQSLAEGDGLQAAELMRLHITKVAEFREIPHRRLLR